MLHHIDIGLALAAAIVNFIFILLVLTRTNLTAVYVTFLLNCAATMIWNFGDFMKVTTGDPFWFYFSLIGTGMIPAVMFHFVNSLVGEKRNRLIIQAAYALCLPLALSPPLALIHAGARSFVEGPAWNVLYILVLTPPFAASATLLMRTIRRTVSINEAIGARFTIQLPATVGSKLG
jgi:hypothetical protein